MADYILTTNKVRFAPTEPEIGDILIEDIAHALSLMTRANGHFPEFYSVAQHCIHCYDEAKERGYSDRVCLACLIHDASEAYLADITRPVKRNLPGYLEYEKVLQDQIYIKFLGSIPTAEEQKLIGSVDDALLCNEFYHYMGVNLFDEMLPVKSNPAFCEEPFRIVEERFLEKFEKANFVMVH